MNRLDLYKAQLKTAKAIMTQRQRHMAAAQRAILRTEKIINTLEKKIEAYMA